MVLLYLQPCDHNVSPDNMVLLYLQPCDHNVSLDNLVQLVLLNGDVEQYQVKPASTGNLEDRSLRT